MTASSSACRLRRGPLRRLLAKAASAAEATTQAALAVRPLHRDLNRLPGLACSRTAPAPRHAPLTPPSHRARSFGNTELPSKCRYETLVWLLAGFVQGRLQALAGGSPQQGSTIALHSLASRSRPITSAPRIGLPGTCAASRISDMIAEEDVATVVRPKAWRTAAPIRGTPPRRIVSPLMRAGRRRARLSRTRCAACSETLRAKLHGPAPEKDARQFRNRSFQLVNILLTSVGLQQVEYASDRL